MLGNPHLVQHTVKNFDTTIQTRQRCLFTILPRRIKTFMVLKRIRLCLFSRLQKLNPRMSTTILPLVVTLMKLLKSGLGGFKIKRGRKKVTEEEDVPLLTLDDDNFSYLPETGRLKYYNPTGDKRISMALIENHQPKAMDVSDLSEANKLVIRNTLKSPPEVPL